MSVRFALISIPSAPCPTAGMLSSGEMSWRIRDSKPKRIKPAAARIMAAYCPSSNLRRRVCKLPRSDSIFKWGKRACNWLWRRKLEVPTTLPSGRLAKLSKSFETNASRASSRSPMAAMVNPSGRFIGTSFIECTAKSARPSAKACSSSFTNKPLPPIRANGESRIWSPIVVMPKISTVLAG